ncbi:unnamed protein product [Caenorhabditis nigoni]
MTLSEIFLVSMTSKKTMKLIKRNIYKVDEVGVKISTQSDEIRAAVYIKVKGKTLNVVGMDFEEKGQVLDGFVDWKVINGYQWISTRHQIQSIHSFVCDIFNIDASNLSVKFSSDICHSFFDIGTIKKCTITDVELESSKSIELFNEQENMNLLIVERSREVVECGNKDYYQDVPTVIHRNTQTRVNWFLTRFQGQHGLLENCFLTGFYVKAFLKFWSENKMSNLVSMIAYQSVQRLFDYEKVLEVLEERVRSSEGNILKALQVETPSEKRIYPYESVITQEHQFEAGTFDCDGGYDVVRNSDGKRATIKISKDYFMFFVWL